MSGGPVVIAGAHNGLGAKLIEEAGFDAVWASGFEISASHGIPDASLLSMSEHLDAATMMVRSTCLPVLVDADTGYGNALNAMRAVLAFETVGAMGLCLEDCVFPKRCSFYAKVRRELVSAEEHALKIRACCDARKSKDFLVIARTEALIAEWPLDEALRRAQAYSAAGADAILVHSKAPTAVEVTAFARKWNRSTPLICVPTTYGQTSVAELHRTGYSGIIFANHGLRAAVLAMQGVLGTLRKTGQGTAVDPMIVSIAEVNRLVRVDQLRAQERAYLPREKA